MSIGKRVIMVVLALALAACVVPMKVQSYTAADGSSVARYGVRCLYPTSLSSTMLLRRPDALVHLEVYGVHGNSNVFSAAIVVESKGEVRLAKSPVEIDSTDFSVPLHAELNRLWARPDSGESQFSFSVAMPSVPKEISLRFPQIEVQGQPADLRRLVLRHEQRYQPTGLCQ